MYTFVYYFGKSIQKLVNHLYSLPKWVIVEDITLSKWHFMNHLNIWWGYHFIQMTFYGNEVRYADDGIDQWPHWPLSSLKRQMLQRSGCCKKKNKLKPIEFYNIVPTLNLRLSRQIDENDRKGEEPVEKKATHLVLPHVLLFGYKKMHKKSEKKSLPFIADLVVISRQAKRGPPFFFFFFFFCFLPCAWGGWKCKAAPLSDAISFRRN